MSNDSGPVRLVPDLAGLDEESYSTSQEATPLPYFAGDDIIAGRVISPIYNQFALVAPQDRPGKK